jgi:hypothetical protein
MSIVDHGGLRGDPDSASGWPSDWSSSFDMRSTGSRVTWSSKRGSGEMRFIVIRDGYGGCAYFVRALQHHVAASLAHQLEPVGFQHPADLLPGENR